MGRTVINGNMPHATLAHMDTQLRFFTGVALIALVICLGGCISFVRTSSGDFDFEKRFDKSTKEILARSIQAEEIALKNHGASIDPKVQSFVQRHFIKADELVQAHFSALSKVTSSFLDPYSRHRAALLKVTLKLQPSLAIIESEYANAVAFPSGKILLSRLLAEAFDVNKDGYDGALLGILIHELIHVRDGHALVQWAMADSRKAWVSDKLIGAASTLTALMPLSIKYDIQYPLTFGAAKQLQSLSEFAADLGAVSLLDRAGYDSSRYIAFLSEMSGNTNASVLEAPSLLWQRVECFEFFSKSQFDEELQYIVVGSDSDSINVTLNLNVHYKVASLLNSPEELVKEFPEVLKTPSSERRTMLLAAIRKVTYTGCAIRRSFPEETLDNGTLTTGSFDLMMFSQYF
jgi:Zn-dependent protease with chaperone function